jgi:molybdopterin-guanine dinucleotide biosynthesis protein
MTLVVGICGPAGSGKTTVAKYLERHYGARSYALADPTTITLTVVSPSGTSTSYTYAGATVTKSATGVYYKDLTPDAAGEWLYRWTGTGTVAAAEEQSLFVRARRVA